MSRFINDRVANLTPYTPGEQPQNRKFVKLNTNESPYPPSKKAVQMASEIASTVQLYSDPEVKPLVAQFCKRYGVKEDQIIFTNGSDEVLNFAFMAFCDKKCGAVFADLTYGFYSVFASLNGVEYREIPLKDDFSIDVKDYDNANATVFIANPNAPTGIALSLENIEHVLQNNPNNVVVIDEAYVDFGGESAIKLIDKYDNLLVTQTFSKSRSLAGARLGVGIANAKIIADLQTVKYSTNPYNVNKMTMAMGVGALEDDEYFKNNCREIIATRNYATEELKKLGFVCTPSMTNFIFCKSDKIDGNELYLSLKEKGVLVRHFSKERIKDYNRITVGTKAEMDILLGAIKEILEAKK